MAKCITKFNTDIRIGVYQFADKKKPRLCIVKGNEIVSYAIFNNMESAEEFMDEVAEFFGVTRKGESE